VPVALVSGLERRYENGARSPLEEDDGVGGGGKRCVGQ
jgi:hypothetical protein